MKKYKSAKQITKIPKINIFIILMAAVMLFLLLQNVINTPKANAAKTDSCQQYQEEAKYYLKTIESLTKDRQPLIHVGSYASVSAAYSGYYLICRDLERRNP